MHFDQFTCSLIKYALLQMPDNTANRLAMHHPTLLDQRHQSTGRPTLEKQREPFVIAFIVDISIFIDIQSNRPFARGMNEHIMQTAITAL